MDKNAIHDQSLGKYKLKPQWNSTMPIMMAKQESKQTNKQNTQQ